VDVRAGIEQIGGSLPDYREVLGIFCGESAEKIAEVRNSLEQGDLKRYTTHVHGLKSAAAAIGANEVSALAKALEDAGKTANTEYIKENTEPFITELEALAARIQQALL
jgi:HPt (histidine-containing phosphotransfer) domain-containing protein